MFKEFLYEYKEREDGSEEDDDNIFEIKKRKRSGNRKGQWPDDTVNDLVDIIVDNDEFKEKLLLTNVKNGHYYEKVVEELAKRCKERNEDFPFDIKQTRDKFKRCVATCRNAVMKVKTSSGIKRFQEDKELGDWFGKLLPVISSMDNCQPSQSIEPTSFERQHNTKTPQKNDTGEER